MITHHFPRTKRVWLIVIVTASILVFSLNHCEQNPLLVALPGNEWVFETEVLDTLDVQQLIRTTAHGGSRSLYAGHTQESVPRESGILIKFPIVDTTHFSDMDAAKLVLIRRTFADELPEPGASFALYSIEEDSLIWSESDTGGTLADFPNINSYSTGSLKVDTVVISSGGVLSDSTAEHLMLPLDTLLLRDWANGTRANNGFLLKRDDQGGLIGFHSRSNTELSPYLAFSYHDTTVDGRDTVKSLYYLPNADLSVYPAVHTALVPSEDLILLDHSTGLRGHLDFDPFIEIDTTSMVAGARLVIHVDMETSSLLAGQIDLRVIHRLEPLDVGDSAAVLIDRVAYSPESDSIILNIGVFLAALAAGSVENFGLDLLVVPRNHDFDRLAIFRSNVADHAGPRLDIIYTKPFQDQP
jgi:hypothetical protein